MFHLTVTTTLENIQKTVYITFNISIWILNGVAHSRLCGQIDYYIKISISKQHLHSLPILEVHPHKTKSRINITPCELIP